MNQIWRIASVFLLTLGTTTIWAKTIFVAYDAEGHNNGTSWDDAYTDPQTAIGNSVTGDEVWVKAGTYTPTSWPNGGTGSKSRHFSLKNGVAVYGGFKGTEDDLGTRNFEANLTIFSGDTGTADDFSDNCEHVFRHDYGSGIDTSAILDGCTITAGMNDLGGAGMYNFDASPLIQNCTFTNHRGAAIYNKNGSSSIIRNCFITDNLSERGAVANSNRCSVLIEDCIFAQNKTSQIVSGISDRNNCTSTIKNCTFSDNQGYAIFASDSSSQNIENCTIMGIAGGIRSIASALTVQSCTITGNEFECGVYLDGSTLLLTNCTISENRLGIRSFLDSECTITNCTLVENVEGIRNEFRSTAHITNSILWNNGTQLRGEMLEVINCIIEDGFDTGVDIIDADPLLQPLFDNGGPVPTMAIPTTSPAFNAGTPSGAPAQDARGISRPHGDGIDLGAYENDGPLSFWFRTQTADDFGKCALGYEGLIQRIPLQGSAMDAQIEVATTDGFEISLDGGSWSQTIQVPTINGMLNKELQIRFVPIVVNHYAGTVSFASDKISDSFAVAGIGVEAKTIYVSKSGNGFDGLSWPTAFRDLQTGITTAAEVAGTEVWVAAGIYKPNDSDPGNLDPDQCFQLRNHVSVYGGFSGNETIRNTRDVTNSTTVASADIGTINDRSDNCYHVFNHPEELKLGKSAILDGLTITDACGDEYFSRPAKTGAICNNQASPVIRNCTISDNTMHSGGGIYNSKSSPVISNCTFFFNNSVGSYAKGGGMHNRFSTPHIENCVFTRNLAADGGGGMYNYESNTTIVNCVFNSNGSVDSEEEGLFNKYSSVTAVNSTFSNSSYHIVNVSSALNLTNCTIAGNFQSAVSNSQSTAAISNCILWENGMDFDGIGFQVSNCVMQSNYPDGTAIFTANPRLDPEGLKDNGGPVPTIAILDGGSGINNADVNVAPALDARGLARTGLPDIGAYESPFFRIEMSASPGGRIKLTESGRLRSTITAMVVEGSDSQPFYAEASTGYMFSKWSDNVEDNPRTFRSVNRDYEVIAKFEPDPNDPPIAVPNNNDVDPQVGETLTLTGSGSSDPDGGPNPLTYSWIYVSGPENAPGPSLTDVSGNNMDVTFVAAAAGDYVFELTVDDGEDSDAAQVQITVTQIDEPNAPPQFTTPATANPTIIQMDGETTLTAEATDADAGDTVSYTWEMVDGPGEVSFTATNAATTDATFSINGTYQLRVIATDGKIDVPSTVVTVVVQPTVVDNNAPEFQTIPSASPNTIKANETTTLTAEATDADAGDTVSYTWEMVEGPEDVTFAAPNAPTTDATFTIDGTYQLRVIAGDGKIDVPSEIVTVIVQPTAVDNNPPTITAIEAVPATIEINGTTTLTVIARELDEGDELTYSWTQISGEEVAIADPEESSTEVSGFTMLGTYKFEVTVSDGTSPITKDVTVEVMESRDTATPPADDDGGGCGCTTTEGNNGTAWLIIFAIAGLIAGRRLKVRHSV